MVNSFEYRIFIDNTPYTIAVDDSQGDRKRIVVNNKVVFDEVCASWMKPRTDIMYIPFYIKNKYIVISIDDRECPFKYNIYIDEVSPIDETNLYDDYNKALKIVNDGFLKYTKNNWERMIYKLIVLGVGFGGFYSVRHSIDLTTEQRVLAIIIAVGFLPVFVLWEWWFETRPAKKFKNRFRTSNIVRL